jgi:hypothetical protein
MRKYSAIGASPANSVDRGRLLRNPLAERFGYSLMQLNEACGTPLRKLLTANLLTMEGQDNGTARAARREDVDPN